MLMQIRPEQMAVFDDFARELYVERTVARLARTFPDFAKQQKDLTAFVEDGIVRSAKYAIVDDAAVDAWLDLMVELGPAFDVAPENAWMSAYLDDRKLDDTVRLRLVRDELANAVA